MLTLLTAVAAALTAAACGSSGGAAAPTATVTVSVSTVTASPSPTPTPTSTVTVPAPAPIPAPAPPATLTPVQVVQAYYAAINAHDYRTAWNLGGYKFETNYDRFAADFAGTADDQLTITGSQGDVVSIRLTAVQTDGSVKYYEGTYTAHGGHLTGASIRQVG